VPIKCAVKLDEFTRLACQPFDWEFTGESTFSPPEFTPPSDFGLGLIVGPSGSGKTTLLREHFGLPSPLDWDESRSVVSQIAATPDEAVQRLCAVGLNSVPTWCKPRHILSTGEGFRADLARSLRDGAVVDEFTSTVDRTVGKAASVGLRRLVDKMCLHRVVVASCHYDIVEWLQPDWVFDTQAGFLPRGSLWPRPKIELEIEPCQRSAWSIFAPHHYLTRSLAQCSSCWWAWWNENLVGFVSVIPFPHPLVKRARREHRTVVLPDYQGFGIGVRLSDAVARHHVEELGYAYYSRTSHPRMGEYRERHPNWKGTDSNRKKSRRGDKGLGSVEHWKPDLNRVCYSHRWIADDVR
jgi:GNAT superfamily N-acetyltransferase